MLVAALPVFIAAGWSLPGYAVGAAVWIAQAIAQGILQAKVDASDDPRTVVGLLAGGSIGRAWFTAAVVLAVGLIDERAGLAAILLVMVLFTTYFATKVFTHLSQEKPA